MKLSKGSGSVKLPPRVSAGVDQLRESRLLIPIVLLVVAIIAAPILLTRSSEPPRAAIAGSEAAGAVEAGSTELDPVVLAETPGLRDYRERLDPFRSNNPFKQQLTDAPKSAGGGGGGGGTGGGGETIADAIADGTVTAEDGAISGGGDALPTIPGGDTGGDPAPAPDPVPDPDPAPDPGNGGNGGSGDDDEPEPDPTKVTVRYGPAGNTQLLIDLKPVHAMAGPDDPLARLRRVGANSAVFGISPQVDLDGEATCLSQHPPCDLMRIKVGETAQLTYRPTGETYRLELLRVK